MEVETSQVTKIKVSELEGLDPISIILEDIAPRQGKVLIECYGKSWNAYWGGMGSETIREFICSCNNEYLIGKLSSMYSQIDDYDNLDKWLKSELIKLRKDLDIGKDKAKELWSDINLWCQNDESFLHSDKGRELASNIIGDDWWHSIPQKTNPDWEYLNRILTAVKQALELESGEQ